MTRILDDNARQNLAVSSGMNRISEGGFRVDIVIENSSIPADKCLLLEAIRSVCLKYLMLIVPFFLSYYLVKRNFL